MEHRSEVKMEQPSFFSAEDFKDMFANNNLEQMEPFLFTTNWLSSSEEHMRVDRAEVSLYHRPRGSKGVWQVIGSGDKVRITTGKGKRLKLTIKSESALPNCTIDTLSKAIKLHDLSDSDEETKAITQTGFTIQSIEYMNKNTIEFQLNVEKGGPKLQFGFFLQLSGESSPTSSPESSSSPMQIFEGKSVEFATHNSGGTVALSTSNPKRKRAKTSNAKPVSESPESSPPHLEQVVVKPEPLPMAVPNWSDTSLSPTSASDDSDITEVNAISSPVSVPLTLPMAETRINLASTKDEKGFDQDNVPDNMFVKYFVPGNLDVKGNIKAKSFSQLSDSRLKTNITAISNALQIVSKLKGKKYQWKQDKTSSLSGIGKPEAEQVIGLIAQEVEKVLPEVVYTDQETGLKSVCYTEILPVLIEAFNEFVNLCRDEEEVTALKLRMLQGNLEQLEREMKEQMDDQRALQMAIISQTFMDKMYPNKPIQLTKKPTSSGWKQNTLKAMFYLIQTAFTLGVVFGVLWYVKPGSKSPIDAHYSLMEHTQSYLYQGKCLYLYGSKQLGWFAYNRCDYAIEPLLKCMDSTFEPEPAQPLQPKEETKLTASIFANCNTMSVMLEQNLQSGMTQETSVLRSGEIQLIRAEMIILYGNATVGWRAFNQDSVSQYPTFRCFGSSCNRRDKEVDIALSRIIDRSEFPMPPSTEVELTDSIGCDLCVALVDY